MGMSVGELFATFRLDPTSVTGALAGLQSQFAGIGSALAGMGLTGLVTRPLKNIAKDIFSTGSAFEATISRVGALSGDAGEALDSIREKALNLGETTSKTAQQAADAMVTLAMAGFKNTQIEDLADPLIKLAEISGSNDLGKLSSYIADTLLAANRGDASEAAKQGTQFVNMFAAAITNSDMTVENFGEAMTKAAPAIAQYGFSLRDVGVAMALFAQNGLKGSSAGNTLNRIMTNMATNTKAAKMIEKTGIALFDEKGKARGLLEIIDDMRAFRKEGKLTADSAEQIGNALTEGLTDKELAEVNKALGGTYGAKGLAAWVNMTDEAYQTMIDKITEGWEGVTDVSQLSMTMLDNVQGKITLLQSKLGTTKIKLNKLMEEPAKGLLNTLGDIVDWFNALDDFSLSGVLNLGGVLASLGPAILGLKGMSMLLPKLGVIMTTMMSPIGLLTTGILGLGAAFLNTNNKIGTAIGEITKEADKLLDQLWEKINKTSAGEMSKNMQNFYHALANSIRSLAPKVNMLVNKLVFQSVQSISDSMQQIGDTVFGLITSMMDGLSANLPRLIPKLADLFTNAISTILTHLPQLTDSIGVLLYKLFSGINSVNVTSSLTAIGIALEKSIAGIRESVLKHGPEIVDGLAKTLGNMGPALGKLLNTLNKAFKKIDFQKLGKNLVTSLGKLRTSLINGLTSFFKNLNTTGLASDFIGYVDDLFNGILKGLKISVPELAKSIGNLISEVGTFVFGGNGKGGVLKTITSKLASFAESLASSMKEIGSKVSESAGDGSLGNAIKGFFDKALESLPGLLSDAGKIVVAGADIASSILTAITDAIKNIDPKKVEETAKSVVQTLSTTLSDVWKKLSGNVEGIVDAGANLADSILSALEGAISGMTGEGGLMETVTKIASGLITKIVDAFSSKDMNEGGKRFSSMAMDLFDGILTSLNTFMADLKGADTFPKITKSLSDLITGVFDGIAEHMPDIMANLGTLFENIGDAIMDEESGLLTSLKTIGTSILTGIQKVFSQIAGGDEGASDMSSIMEGIAQGIVTALTDAMSVLDTGIDGLTGAGAKIADFLINSLTTAVSAARETGLFAKIGEFASSLITGIVDSLTKLDFAEGTKELVGLGVNLANGIVDALSAAFSSASDSGLGGNIANFAFGLIQSIVDRLSQIDVMEGTGKIVGLGIDLANGIIDALSSAVSKASESGLGSNIANFTTGLIQSIVDRLTQIDVLEGTGKLVGLGVDLANGIVDALSTAVSSASESGLGGKIADFTLGLIKSIVDQLTQVNVLEGTEKLVGLGIDLANGIVDALSTAFKSAGESGLGGNIANFTFSMIQSIVNRLSQVDVMEGTGKLAGLGIDLASGLVDALTTALSPQNITSLTTGIGDLAGNLVNAIVGAFKKEDFSLEDASYKVSSLGMNLVKGILESINSFLSTLQSGNAFEGISDLFVQLGNGIINGIKDNAPALVGAIGETLSTIGTSLFDSEGGLIASVMKGAKDLAGSLFDALSQGFATIKTDGETDALKGMAEGLLDALSVGISTIFEGGKKLGKVALDLGGSLIKALSSSLAEFKEADAGIKMADIGGQVVADLLKSIKDGLTSDKFDEIMTNIGNGLRDALYILGSFGAELIGKLFSEDTLALVLQAGESMANLLLQGLKAGLHGLSGLIDGILTGLLDQFGLIDTDAMKAEADLGKALHETILTSVTSESGEIVHDANTALASILYAIGWGDEYEDVLIENTNIAGMFDSVYKAILDNSDSSGFHGDANLLQSIFEQAFSNSEFDYNALAATLPADFWENALQGITSNANKGEGMDFLNVLMASLLGGVESMDTAEVQDAVAAEMDKFAQTAVEQVLKVPETISGDVAKALEGAGITTEQLYQLKVTPELEVAIGEAEGADDVVTAVQEAIDKQMSAAEAQLEPETITQPVEVEAEVKEADTTAVERIYVYTSNIEEVSEKIRADIEALKGTALETLALPMEITLDAKFNVNKALKDFDSIAKSIGNLADIATTNGTTFGTNLTAALSSAGSAAKEEANTASNGIKSAVENNLSSANGNSIGTAFMGGLQSAIASGGSTAASGARNISGTIRSAAASALNRAAGYTIGQNFTSGLAAGIQSGIGKATAAVNELTAAVKEASMSGLDEHSPSKFAYEVGHFFDAGLRNGILHDIPIAVGAIDAMTSAVVERTHDGLGVHSDSKITTEDGKHVSGGLATGIEAGMGPISRSIDKVTSEINQKIQTDMASSIKDNASHINSALLTGFTVVPNIGQVVNQELDMIKKNLDIVKLLPNGGYIDSNGQIISQDLLKTQIDELRKNVAKYGKATVTILGNVSTDDTLQNVVDGITDQTTTSTNDQLTGPNKSNNGGGGGGGGDDASATADTTTKEESELDKWRKENQMLIQEFASIVADALAGQRVEMDGQEVGIIVAPTVSELITGGARARRFAAS